MENKEPFDLAKSRAENFGLDLEEAYDTMLAFSLENKFDCYSIEERNQLDGFNRGYFISADKAELLDGAKAFYNQVQKEQKRLSVLLNADLESYKALLKGADMNV